MKENKSAATLYLFNHSNDSLMLRSSYVI